MDLYEFQAKSLLRHADLPVLKGDVIKHPSEIDIFWKGQKLVLKAQSHAGGRGKAGAVAIISEREEALSFINRFLKKQLVTVQTDSKGEYVPCIYAEEACEVLVELYVSFSLDRANSKIQLIVSGEGGTEIETKAKESFFSIGLNPYIGIRPYHVLAIWDASKETLQKALGEFQFRRSETSLKDSFSSLIEKLYAFYVQRDLTLLEINPLAVVKTSDTELAWFLLDAKVTIDDSALYRHSDLQSLQDVGDREEFKLQEKARVHGLSYVKLDGNIGCMVNGAGLAMATLDLLSSHNGRPANFLDVGGGVSVERVRVAFQIITNSPSCRVIFVNIFGGIVRCDVIAQGILDAIQEELTEYKIPIVVRLQGTNAQDGKNILSESKMPIIYEENLDNAAKMAIFLAMKEC